MLQCVAAYRSILQCVLPQHRRPQEQTAVVLAPLPLQCVLQSVAVCCSVLQCVAVCLVSSATFSRRPTRHSTTHAFIKASTMQHTSTHCKTPTFVNPNNAPIHTNPPCNTVQHAAIHSNSLQLTATHCNTAPHKRLACAQHIAIHCNTLQRTVTHCNTLHHRPTKRLVCATPHTPLHHTKILTPTHPTRKGSKHPQKNCKQTRQTPDIWVSLQHTATHCNTLQRTATHCDTHT